MIHPKEESETEWVTTNEKCKTEWVTPNVLLEARHRVAGCGKIVAHYRTEDCVDCELGEHVFSDSGWTRDNAPNTCICNPPPTLPGADELARLIRRARRARPTQHYRRARLPISIT